MIQANDLEPAMSFSAYLIMTKDLVDRQMTTGPNQTEALIAYTKLNLSRMLRVEKKAIIMSALEKQVREIDQHQTWLLFTESWCGDAAQSVPLIARLAALNEKIELKILLRDENDGLFGNFLTRGARSIPKLAILSDQMEVLSTWGPRPRPLQDFIDSEVKKGTDGAIIREEAQRWYNQDKTLSIQKELAELL